MLSQFFYLPANQKATEEQRIEFTQSKLKLVKDFLSQHFLSARYANGHPFAYNETNWQVYVGDKVVINQNYWNEKIDEFQAQNRCKIDQLDYLYLLMQLWRDVNGRKLSISEGTLGISLYFPMKKIVQKKETEKNPTTNQEIKIKINPKKFRVQEHTMWGYTNPKNPELPFVKYYTVQKKGWFFWNDIEEYNPDADTSFPVSFATVEEAENYLVDYIRLNGYMGETIIYPSADTEPSVL